eukprot:TRINITY_DN21740_c0_g1_i2.p1 TRINITY_DN21740_c0_g1~~TRINITY_DN21740_c0_g1_i2.p1  ORF type:complete len:646 (+),score=113.75 TRINITY_DN21740_c0_g1_i2:148-1938(+)
MTEFGKACKELERLEELLKEKEKRVGVVIASGDEAAIKGLRREFDDMMQDVEGLRVKAEKFRQKAEEPAETRLYSEKMVERVTEFVEKHRAFESRAVEAPAPLSSWLEKLKVLRDLQAEIARKIDETMIGEAAGRTTQHFESDEWVARVSVEYEMLKEVTAAENQLTEGLNVVARRIAGRERKKQKKKDQQAALREDAEKRKKRDKEAWEDQLRDAFETRFRQVVKEETKKRTTITEEEADTHLSMLNSHIKTSRRLRSPQKHKKSPTRRSPPTGRVTPPRGDRPKSPKQSRSGRSKGKDSGVAGKSAELSEVPEAILELPYTVEAIPNTPSVLLTNTHHKVELTVYRCLLGLRDQPDYTPFQMPVELLTDRKAKKRYEAKGGRKTVEDDEDELEELDYEDEDDEDDEDVIDDDDILSVGSEEEEEKEGALPGVVSMGFIRNVTEGCVVVMLSVGGSFAGGIFIAGDCLVHTTFSRYITRKKQGGRQSNHEGRSDTVGSQLRRTHEFRFKELISQQLHAWSLPLTHATAIFLHAPSPVNRMPFFAPTPLPPSGSVAHGLKKGDPRILPVPLTTKKPTFTEVKRVYASMVSCVYKSS